MTHVSQQKPRTNLSFNAFKGNNLLEIMVEVIPNSTIMPMFGELGFFIRESFVGIYSDNKFYFRKPRNDCSAIYSSFERKKHPKYFCFELHSGELEDKYFILLFFTQLEIEIRNEFEYSETTLKNAANLKASIASSLEKVDIDSLKSLTKIGSVNAYLRLKANATNKKVPLSVLYKLEGAIRNIHVAMLDPNVTKQLKNEVDSKSWESRA